MSDTTLTKEHEFPQAKPHEILWRYMSFKKFRWLLENQLLYQACVSRFEDPFEGSLPIKTKMEFEKQFNKLYPSSNLKRIEEKREYLRDTSYASCWSLRESESEAFWKIYCKGNDSITIKTTYGKLEKYASSEFDIIGKVKYINYNTDSFELWSPATPFMHKRDAFDFESEVRIITIYMPTADEFISTFPDKMVIKVPIEELIDRIVIHPSSPENFIDFVKYSVSKYSEKLVDKVTKSKLVGDPIF